MVLKAKKKTSRVGVGSKGHQRVSSSSKVDVKVPARQEIVKDWRAYAERVRQESDKNQQELDKLRAVINSSTTISQIKQHVFHTTLFKSPCHQSGHQSSRPASQTLKDEPQLHLVDRGSDEERALTSLIRVSVPKMRLMSIYRVSNIQQWTRYEKTRSLLPNTSEEIMFHGTSTNNPRRIWKSANGLDVYKSKSTAKVIWVARDASYSCNYTHRVSHHLYPFKDEQAPKDFSGVAVNNKSYCQMFAVRMLMDTNHVKNIDSVRVTSDNASLLYPQYLITYTEADSDEDDSSDDDDDDDEDSSEDEGESDNQ